MKTAIHILSRRKWLILAVLALGSLWYTYHISEMRISDAELVAQLERNAYSYIPKVSYLEQGKRKIRYVEVGNDSLPLIVFIHGAPSSSAFWLDFLRDSSLLSEAKLMAVDRPGYGYSNFGKSLISVKEQARLIANVIKTKRHKHKNIILHGSSYGGTVAARIAMDFPDLADGLLLQSASMAPGEEKTYSISYPTSHWSLKWLIPATLRVANAEKLSHKSQLTSMAEHWDKIKSAVIIMHGDADQLIYPPNAIYAAQRLKNASCLDLQMYPGRGHDLLWNKTQELKDALSQLIWFTNLH